MAARKKTMKNSRMSQVQHKPLEGPVPPPSKLSVRLLNVEDLPLPNDPLLQRQVAILEPDPLHPQFSVAFLVAAQRMMTFAQQFPSEISAEAFVRQALARLCVKDPTIKLLVAVDTASGEALGHALVTIESNGMDRWAFCWQAHIDQGTAGVLQQMIAYSVPWVKQQGGSHILMATQMDPAFWEQRYGFKVVRHVMSLDI